MNIQFILKIPAEDRKHMADFYTKVFVWKTQHLDVYKKRE
ncbi:hypothetical protein NVIE_028860 [Nitrososphaera viennensis EN76]|uniref:Uncharacterized protein n=1 Tax=Nitrososphaera viennensis EN76 TaxID=926571 RepID=A0A060HUQ6_9ARCH|nr:hypothetical protein NVIE_028860 [Nitrososphaera viennensis EN76]